MLASTEVRKVVFDLKSTEVLFAREGIRFAGETFDPMLAAYLIDPEAPSGLKELARRELGVEARAYGDGAAKGKKGAQVPFDQLPHRRSHSLCRERRRDHVQRVGEARRPCRARGPRLAPP